MTTVDPGGTCLGIWKFLICWAHSDNEPSRTKIAAFTLLLGFATRRHKAANAHVCDQVAVVFVQMRGVDRHNRKL
jgi:hypothetical protein